MTDFGHAGVIQHPQRVQEVMPAARRQPEDQLNGGG